MAFAPRSFRALLRMGLLARFSILSLVAFIVLGVVLAQILTAQVRSRAIANSTQSAELVARFGIEPLLSQANLDQGLSPETINSLDSLLHAGYTSASVRTIRIWSRDSRIVYSPDHSLIGRAFAGDDGLDSALGGRDSADLSSGRGDGVGAGAGPTIDAYVPLRSAGGAVAGAFEVHLRYAPVAAAISSDTNRLYAALAIGLLLLYGALFRIVWGASRRLRRQAADNEHQAKHDTLTGLPNRGNFYARVDDAIDRGGELAVMIIDLDRFKEVNDTLGHHAGDMLLRQAGDRLRAALRPGDLLARLGGDEFAVLMPSLRDRGVACGVAERIAGALEQPFALDDLTVHVEASIGIALCPEHSSEGEALMRQADVAMYAAKAASKPFAVYSADEDTTSPSRLAMLGEMRAALDSGEFVLHYQPKANLHTGRIEGAEALIRWEHPERGLVPPDQFIPLAERTGVIKPLTAWVLDTALGQCSSWRDAGLNLDVAVNLSVRNLLDSELPQLIGSLLNKWQLPPQRLQLEITEGTIIADQVRALDVLGRLDRMGVGLVIDDFGTGYSSLAYLKDLPVRELKIDRTFIKSMIEDGNDAFIVRSTIDLGRNLGLQVVAEGVETEAHWSQLIALGCDIAQGYYLSRPVPADDLAAFLAAREASGASPIDIQLPSPDQLSS